MSCDRFCPFPVADGVPTQALKSVKDGNRNLNGDMLLTRLPGGQILYGNCPTNGIPAVGLSSPS